MLKNLLLLTGFSTFVVIIIVGLDVYHKYTLSTLPPKTQKNIVPIESKFDKTTIDSLKKRTPVPVNLQERSSVTSEDSEETTSSPTPGVSPTLSSSGSGVIIPTLSGN